VPDTAEPEKSGQAPSGRSWLTSTRCCVETIAIAGKEYTLDAASGKWTAGSGTSKVTSVIDPLGNVDASVIHDVVEVDRPEIDGRKTRHLRYQADTTKIIAGMRQSAGASPQSISNAQGTGELWIRIDDSQIVRQLVKVSLDVDGLAGLASTGIEPDQRVDGDVAGHALLASRRGVPQDHGSSGRALSAPVQTGSNAVTASREGGSRALSPA